MSTQTDERDALTNLLKRDQFSTQLRQSIEEAQTSEQPLSLAFLDIDCFLEINNRYGHAFGDQVLIFIAEAIRNVCGKSIKAFRYGGDELILIFPNTEREQAFLVAEQLRLYVHSQQIQLKGSNGVEDQTASVQISVGVANYPIDGSSEDELFRSLDSALYRAKVAGRNKVKLAYEDRMLPKTAHYTQTQLERLNRLAQEQGVSDATLLREALDNLLVKYGVNTIER